MASTRPSKKVGFAALAALLAVGQAERSAAECPSWYEAASIGGGPAAAKLRVDPAEAENLGQEIGRFWQSSNSSLGHNFDGGCPSSVWWLPSEPPLRGIRAFLGSPDCHASTCPFGDLTLVVEEQDAFGSEAYFIAFRVDETPAATRRWDYARTVAGPSPKVAPLEKTPQPTIVDYEPHQGPNIKLTLHYPDLAAHVHAVQGPGDTVLPASAVISSWHLYGAVDDLGREVEGWTLLDVVPYVDGGATKEIVVSCFAHRYLALGVGFDGGAGPEVASRLVGRPQENDYCGNVFDTQGFVVPFDGGDPPCAPPELAVVDPCTGGYPHPMWSGAVDLAPLTGQYVRLLGFSPPFTCFAGTAEVLLPAEPACLIQVKNLKLARAPGAVELAWDPLIGAESYDVVRGSLSALTEGSLGDVLCLADDVAGTAAVDVTGEVPPPGEAFIYAVRPNGVQGFEYYGHSSAHTPRLPASGDCTQ